jgi:hypothetical protein
MRIHPAAGSRMAPVVFCVLCLSLMPCRAQDGGTRPPPAAAAQPAAQSSAQEAASLVGGIKSVESPAFRAYLYARVVLLFKQSAETDAAVRQVVLDAARAGVADLSEHETEVPPTPASGFYWSMLDSIRRYAPEEAERVKDAHPLRRELRVSDEAKKGAAFYSALARLNNPQTSAQGAQESASLIAAGGVPAMTLLGELLKLDQGNSPALPQLLAATLTLLGRNPNAVPLQTLFFLSQIYLKDSTPTQLQVGFLAAVDRATQVDPTLLRRDPSMLSPAVQLLQRSLPRMQQLKPDMYAQAAARLASLSPAATQEDPVYSRIKNSPDPLAQTISEADLTKDPKLRAELLESAARRARRQGQLRLAVELITSAEKDRRDDPEGYSSRDDFLSEVLGDALKLKDVETARRAAAGMDLPVNRAEALRKIAGYFIDAKDTQPAAESLNDAAKSLAGAPAAKEKAASLFRLAADFAEIDGARSRELLLEGVKTANDIPRPDSDPEGKFSWSLFPLADTTIKAFQRLARSDRDGTLSTAESFRPKEFRIAATLGANYPVRK